MLKAFGILAVSLFSINVFAVTESEVIAMATESVEQAVKIAAVKDGCAREGFIDMQKLEEATTGGVNLIVLRRESGGGSAEGSGNYNETYSGAIIVAATEAYATANRSEPQAVKMVLGIELNIKRADCGKSKTTAQLNVFRSKSNKRAFVSAFTIKE